MSEDDIPSKAEKYIPPLVVDVDDLDDGLPSILNNKVSMTNLAMRGAQGFTLREKRLVMCGLSKLDSRTKRKYISLKDRTFRVTAAEYAELSGTSKNDAYKDLTDACKNLRTRFLRYRIETPTGIKERVINWVSSLTYHKGEGWVDFSLTEEFMPHCTALERQFTTYRLKQAKELRSLYSWRLLELLTSLTNDEHKERKERVELADLRLALDVPESYRYDHIKQRAIIPAVKELTSKDDWLIEWKPIKTGRSVTAIMFTYSRSKQKDMFKEGENEGENEPDDINSD